jgi:glycosyltransferase involved in cell wall biosynthesis
LHVLIQAIESKTLDFRLDVVGSLKSEPGYARELQRQVESFGLKSNVSFHGSLDHERLAEFLRSAHVLVVPSSYEGYGIAYLEGMAFGLPAIGTTAGAAPEIIADGETGFLIAPGDASTLAARLEILARDRELLARLSLNALRRYRAQPKWPQTAGAIRAFLERRLG